jgi:DNA invertase Pin-like site-specific DNA recombinase
MNTAVAYYRTSSQTNVGEDKDSLKRQQDAVRAYAKRQGLEIVREFYDAAVRGGDPVEGRPGFAEMLGYMLGNGARIVLVENAGRFARDLTVQLLGHALLKKHGIELIPVDAPAYFTDETPTARMVRSILGAVSQFEKEALVLKLRKARERSKRLGGNPNWKPVPAEHVQAALAAKAKGLSLRAIASELSAAGYLSPTGKQYGPESIKRMVGRQ